MEKTRDIEKIGDLGGVRKVEQFISPKVCVQHYAPAWIMGIRCHM